MQHFPENNQGGNETTSWVFYLLLEKALNKCSGNDENINESHTQPHRNHSIQK